MAKKFAEHDGLNLVKTNQEVLAEWEKNDIFHKSIDEREGCPQFIFFEGPPSANGHPGIHHVLARAIKDTFNRYKTMKGYQVHRKAGWDTHGLPVELGVEKELGITKKDIDNKASQKYISTEDYNKKCRENVMMFTAEWRELTEKMGYFVDLDHPYITYDNKYIETLWWLLKQLYNKGLLYKGYTIQPYSPAAGTGLSSHELNQPGCYRDVKDTTVTAQFLIKDPKAEWTKHGKPYFIAWTTTPWTLPSNVALCVGPKIDYVAVETYNLYDGQPVTLIMAESRVSAYLNPEQEVKEGELGAFDKENKKCPWRIVDRMKGSDLEGLHYGQLMPWVKPCEKVDDFSPAFVKDYAEAHTDKVFTSEDGRDTFVEMDSEAFRVILGDYVTTEDGTGIVHIAPAYGEDDFELAKHHGISAFHVIDDNGYYTDGNYKGLEVWDHNKFIAKDLKEKGAVWKIEYIRHEYPFNPRSKQRIMYRAIPSWFFDIQGQKPLMLEQNEHINWFPSHLKHGRFAKNIEQAPDWNLSRDRFWATAMPVWKGDRGTVKVVGSYAELKELSGVELDDYHRPWVDDITFEIDGETFTRIDKVLDCWFESGSMPFAQLHYPFENQTKFEQNYPADFIVEYIGQVRAWFYYVHAVNAALAEIGAFGEAGAQHKNAYSNVITTGVVAGNDGRKMSKSLGNFTNPNELMDKFSADSLRFLLLSSPLLNGEDFALHDKDVGDVARKLSMIWNMYDFFTMYAEVDGWEFDGELRDPLSDLTNPLDIWIISRLHQLVAEVERHMDTYNIPDALSQILPFLDDASNWYVRRSRRRFWKSEDDGDKNDAYRTLHYVLVRLSYILAPFTPFLAEELYRNLTGDNESIHLKDWLTAGAVNDQALADMSRTRELINNGLSLRMKQDEHQVSIKVRQPLQSAAYAGAKLAEYYEQIMAEELNVKEIRWIENLDEHLADYEVAEGAIKPESWIEISKQLTPELKREGLMREVIRHVQSARKKAGLQVDDRIMLQLTTDDEQLRQAIDEHAELIAAETLATFGQSDAYSTTVVIEGAELQITLQRQ